jgi:hypothetical protein
MAPCCCAPSPTRLLAIFAVLSLRGRTIGTAGVKDLALVKTGHRVDARHNDIDTDKCPGSVGKLLVVEICSRSPSRGFIYHWMAFAYSADIRLLSDAPAKQSPTLQRLSRCSRSSGKVPLSTIFSTIVQVERTITPHWNTRPQEAQGPPHSTLLPAQHKLFTAQLPQYCPSHQNPIACEAP